MKQMMTVQEAAQRWGVPGSQVTRYCREGRVEGAVKDNGIWLIPESAQKPSRKSKRRAVDNRDTPPVRKPLPIGVSNYAEACTNYYYVDKTMLIKEFIDERPKVSLFTRPRRFGKTLNMDMLKTFFEITREDTSVYFQDKKIWSCGQYYRDYQGKYPVIFLTFKDVKCDTWAETYDLMAKLIRLEFKRHAALATSDKISSKDFYDKIIGGQASENDHMMSLMMLSQMLDEHYGIPPIIIIDEYDTPIQQGHTRSYYDKVILFMRNLFSGGLKDNKHLSFGFLTGILRIAKESIFSGLNNLAVNSILDQKYSEYFGFTPDEVREMAAYYGATDRFDELCEWYDGYRFGSTEIFNPWSVINYFRNNCQPSAYWQSTGSNDIIGEVLAEANEDIYERLNALLQGKTILTTIDTSVIYPQIKNDPSSIYSFLLVAGYLKVVKSDPSVGVDLMCEVALPNKEIAFVYNKEILTKLSDIVPQPTVTLIREALYSNNAEALKRYLEKLLIESVSFHDTAKETFYHGLVLGLCAMMDSRYLIRSNRESGTGRYDIQLMPKNCGMPGILIELKATGTCTAEKLSTLAQDALDQINENNYDTEMQSLGVQTILKFGVAFCGKDVAVAAE